ncbi:undecaprenyl-diphosphatase [Clostridium estertheticum]|nr:undecaprenyl-diphosphatase [Clostridium estertheticum]WLC77348.1 undecaprenyl-diphosphatase [Clostridium estertheticum]
MKNMNLTLFRLINNLAKKNSFLDAVMIVSSKYVIYLYALLLGVYLIIGYGGKNKKAKEIVNPIIVLITINFILTFIIGIMWHEQRPFSEHTVNLLYTHKNNASFPSTHAIGVMTIALGVNNKTKKLGKLLIILAIIVGISRVYVGHHYPFDVLCGFLLAIISNYIYIKGFSKTSICKKMRRIY